VLNLNPAIWEAIAATGLRDYVLRAKLIAMNHRKNAGKMPALPKTADDEIF
jgi:hypothetical protein